MALTIDFKETVQARVRRDPAFRHALLQEAVTAMLAGDLGAGKAICATTSTPRWASRSSAAPPARRPRA